MSPFSGFTKMFRCTFNLEFYCVSICIFSFTNFLKKSWGRKSNLIFFGTRWQLVFKPKALLNLCGLRWVVMQVLASQCMLPVSDKIPKTGIFSELLLFRLPLFFCSLWLAVENMFALISILGTSTFGFSYFLCTFCLILQGLPIGTPYLFITDLECYAKFYI